MSAPQYKSWWNKECKVVPVTREQLCTVIKHQNDGVFFWAPIIWVEMKYRCKEVNLWNIAVQILQRLSYFRATACDMRWKWSDSSFMADSVKAGSDKRFMLFGHISVLGVYLSIFSSLTTEHQPPDKLHNANVNSCLVKKKLFLELLPMSNNYFPYHRSRTQVDGDWVKHFPKVIWSHY